MVITFPSTYVSGMGLGATCTAQDEKSNAYATCTVATFSVTIGIGELSNSPVDHTYSLVLKGVKNPSVSGATGYFRFATYKGINLLDYSD
jgi:hypothetical protein